MLTRIPKTGTPLECFYSLITFGIHRKIIPFNDDGDLDLARFLAHLKALQESAQPESERPDYPKTNDILLGRGRPFQEYSGNLFMAKLIDSYRERYSSAGRCDKAILAQHLVDVIKGSGGRFLKKSDSGNSWIEVEDTVAQDKVGHVFRTKTKRNTPSNTNAVEDASGNQSMEPSMISPQAIPSSFRTPSSDTFGYPEDVDSAVVLQSNAKRYKSATPYLAP